MLNSQEFNLFSQTFRLDREPPQLKNAERKTIPLFMENCNKDNFSLNKKEIDNNFKSKLTFTYIPVFKTFAKEENNENNEYKNSKNINSNVIQSQRVEYQRKMKTYIIKPTIGKKGKKKTKRKNYIAMSRTQRGNNEIKEESSSQTSVDESENEDQSTLNKSEDYKENGTLNNSTQRIKPIHNFNLNIVDINDLSQININEKVNVVLYNIKVIKIDKTDEKTYAIFVKEGENIKNILHYDLEDQKKVLSLLTQRRYIQCKLLQRSICSDNHNIKNVFSYTLLETFN